jgi:hypothetical protein
MVSRDRRVAGGGRRTDGRIEAAQAVSDRPAARAWVRWRAHAGLAEGGAAMRGVGAQGRPRSVWVRPICA